MTTFCSLALLLVFALPLNAKARRPEPGKSEEVYSLTQAKPVSIASKKTRLPLVIFGESAGASASYGPSGYMGDAESMKVKTGDISAPVVGSTRTGTSSLLIEIVPKGREGWSGLYWQTPANNWGKVKGAGYDLSAAQKLTFWARGEKGGERIAEVKIGGFIGPYPDTDLATMGPIKLTKEWTQYTIDLKGKDLRHIVGGFAFSVRRSDNPRGAVFYLDEIVFEGNPSLAVEAPAPVAAPEPPQPKPVRPVKIIVPFSDAKAAFSREGKEGIDEIAAVAASTPGLHILVEGHTDNVGPRELNQKLSLQRARVVADYLVAKGVPRDIIEVIGYGEDRPIREGSNDTAQGRLENRRVEVTMGPKP